MRLFAYIFGVIVLSIPAFSSTDSLVSAAEMNAARQWISAKFEGVVPPSTVEPGLVVLANNGPVQMNSRAGQPLKIGETEYTRGLYCHAVSRVLVRLPSPGKRFRAIAGVDSHAGGGSVVFSVKVRGSEVFNSGVRHILDPGAPVDVDLKGTTEFTLDVGDAGDGIGCDQADWADACVELANGKSVWLGDMRIGSQKPMPAMDPPFSFNLDGKPFADTEWKLDRSHKKLDDNRIERILMYTHAGTGLVVKCAGIEYLDFPTVEWVVHFKNEGKADTPIISDIQALNARFESGSQDNFLLHHHAGTTVTPRDFEPLDTPMKSGDKLRFAPPGGRPLGVVFPYYNIEWENEGVIAVVGWPGQWAAEFTRDEALSLNVRAGQELTHLKLKPGEEIRTPLIVLQFWQGDRMRSQNVWRRWMIAHSLPRYGGKLPEPMMPEVSGNHFPGLLCNEKDEILFLDRYAEEGIKPDYWWMDAGWYPNKGSWSSTGTWEVDKTRFPGGLKAVSDHARSMGIKTIVWFEPERVTPGSWLYENHRDWLLGKDGETKLLNLGNPDARKWVTDHTDKIMTQEGIDSYRQDYNIDPLRYWRANDAPDRQGITENHYVTGYLAFWDELRRRKPNMLIDSCASGGHRNDLETMRRAVPLLRSDYIFDPVGEQGHTYGLASWLPYYGTGFINFDTYIFRSTMCPNTTLGPDVRRKDIDWPLLRKLIGQWKQVAHYYYGDFYPLTPYNLSSDLWIAWQFDRPDTGEGMVQSFRRTQSPYEAARFRLHGLDPSAEYSLEDFDAPGTVTVSGRDLMDKGLSIALKDQPAAGIVVYKRLNGAK